MLLLILTILTKTVVAANLLNIKSENGHTDFNKSLSSLNYESLSYESKKRPLMALQFTASMHVASGYGHDGDGCVFAEQKLQDQPTISNVAFDYHQKRIRQTNPSFYQNDPHAHTTYIATFLPKGSVPMETELIDTGKNQTECFTGALPNGYCKNGSKTCPPTFGFFGQPLTIFDSVLGEYYLNTSLLSVDETKKEALWQYVSVIPTKINVNGTVKVYNITRNYTYTMSSVPNPNTTPPHTITFPLLRYSWTQSCPLCPANDGLNHRDCFLFDYRTDYTSGPVNPAAFKPPPGIQCTPKEMQSKEIMPSTKPKKIETESIVPVAHSSYTLEYQPFISASPVKSTLLKESTNKAGRLYTLSSSTNNYTTPVQLIYLAGSPSDIGQAYGELLHAEINNTYSSWYPDSNPQLEATLDWLFNCSLKPHIPLSLLEELNGIQPVELRTKVTRVMTGSTMPADANNIQILLENAIRNHGNVGNHCQKGAKDILLAAAAKETSPKLEISSDKMGLTHHCDFFAVWGTQTKDGRLLSTRNLDIKPATGISKHKLVTIYNIDNIDNVHNKYATVGYPGYIGALAGMNNRGITVSEANLDNSAVSFDGIPWPMRLRQILGNANTLDDAITLWKAAPNTAAFNFLIADGVNKRAVALETNALYSELFYGNSSVERDALYNCTPGTVLDGHNCSWPYNQSERIEIGCVLEFL